jgi:hypothetical protein
VGGLGTVATGVSIIGCLSLERRFCIVGNFLDLANEFFELETVFRTLECRDAFSALVIGKRDAVSAGYSAISSDPIINRRLLGDSL